ncbi:MAG: cobyric acid synthase [Pseudobutyrivibrio sp.]|nr:cobyric acid synthase [Pseudobutyrivibrio sp.]
MSKVIMIQGTMSNVGKSLLVGALCRIFKQDGLKVAPFKSQNMALNSFVTKDGLEMGRAQVMQAECAGVTPSVYMNPILLKPTNDIGSQVIVNGEVIGNMKAREYFAYKRKLIPDIMAAYDKLSQWADVIVIEGAGSPAEINLKADDIVNMGMAKLVDAPVLLVGDIDRGGVFAQLLGTLELLEPDERDRIKGLIINKFRGDKSLLDSGIEMLEARGGVPVVGTVPYARLMIDDEDSLSERLDNKCFGAKDKKAVVEVAVVRLPKISNFTDVAPFENIPKVEVRFVTKPAELNGADIVIVPGSKNTISDMKWLIESGMATAIQRFAVDGTVVGICGGFQMLGETISDPDGVESDSIKSINGLGLLEMETVMERAKQRKQVEGYFDNMSGLFEPLSGQKYFGYEIHNGRSTIGGRAVTSVQRGNIFGTYVHGIFDNGDIALKLAKALASKKGMTLDAEGMDYQSMKEKEYDKLANIVRSNLDMEYIYSLLK